MHTETLRWNPADRSSSARAGRRAAQRAFVRVHRAQVLREQLELGLVDLGGES